MTEEEMTRPLSQKTWWSDEDMERAKEILNKVYVRTLGSVPELPEGEFQIRWAFMLGIQALTEVQEMRRKNNARVSEDRKDDNVA